MELIQPERLAWLLLLPLLYLLSRPPRPRRTVATAHLAQWLAARRKLRRRPVRFRWWRFLLLIAAFAALVLAHAGPHLGGRAGATDLVVLLDASASMTAKASAAPSAWTRAVGEADRLLATLPDHVDVRLGICGPRLQVWRGERAALRTRLAALRPAGRNRVDVTDLVPRLCDARTAVLHLTDGHGPLATAGAQQVFGTAQPNVAITGCQIDDAWPLPEIEVRITVGNFGPARTVAVRLRGAVESTAARRLDLEPGATQVVEFALRRAAGGSLQVMITDAAGAALTDAQALDDGVAIGLPPPPRPQIAVRSEGAVHPALTAAAAALAAECGGTVVRDAEIERAGFLLIDGGRLASVPRGLRMLSFGTAFGADPIFVDAPAVVDWHRTDPVTSDLDLSELRVRRALRWDEGLGLALIRGGGGPLAVSIEQGAGARVVHFAFRLDESNLFKLAAFPQLLRRAFAGAYGAAGQPVIDSGTLLDGLESDLRRSPGPAVDRPLPAFAEMPMRLAVPLLILALLFLAIRAYV